MTTLYVVSAGEYSDYGICGIFSTKENAEKYMDAVPKEGYGSYNDIEEYTLDEYLSEIDRGLKPYRVIMYRSGKVYRVEPCDYVSGESDHIHWFKSAHWSPPEPWANFHAWAKDDQGAIKIANERRIMDLATRSE